MQSTAELQRIRELYKTILSDPKSSEDALELASRVMALDALLCNAPDFPRDWIPF